MSVNSTQVTVVGRVVSEITTRVTSGGTKVANFRLLAQERNYDRTTNTWADGDRMYMTVVCWRRLADNVAESLRERDPVVVHGRLSMDEYTTKDGDHRSNIEVTAWAVGPDLALNTVTVNRPDWSVSPNQQTLLTPPPDEPPTQEEVAQAA
jgi:single-strand DNA-binding protein